MTDDIYVSFIIPVYNVEKYLSQCIESVLKQTIRKKEIILVNDGSKDNSLNICRFYKKKYNFIKIIDKKNEGVSIARNEGIKKAMGKYICFIDADDFYTDDNFASEFFDICEENNLDIIRGIYSIYYEETNKYCHPNLKKLSYYNKSLCGKDFLCYSIAEDSNEVVPWLGFFKKSFLLDNNLRFPRNIAYEEDQLFFLEALLINNCTIMQVDREFYSYRFRKDSVTKTPTIKQANDVIFIVNEELFLIDSLDLESKYDIAARKYASSSFYQLTSIYGRVEKKYRKIIRQNCTRYIRRSVTKYTSNTHQMVKNYLFFYLYFIVDLVYDLRKKNSGI
ncbi:putative glycosyltransferase EpsJ [Thomasclavelia cocleata]|uniref:Putative glycosyltransferase EpsJ n=1 Tax=Thomasclavelia cocleata TaxID=69824 RepID=A0A829Z8J3_9FIRM|nr:glycosyltransferase [Thomasclavelia cocleata]GFI40417.1 putative glycosyltransferase EpsJ [Thomasclavelia cocleata]